MISDTATDLRIRDEDIYWREWQTFVLLSLSESTMEPAYREMGVKSSLLKFLFCCKIKINQNSVCPWRENNLRNFGELVNFFCNKTLFKIFPNPEFIQE